MKTALFCFSDDGCLLARRLCTELKLPDAGCIHTIEKFAVRYGLTAHASIRADMQTLYAGHDALIFIGACGIAVREIAPYIGNKAADPAVVCIDDRGRFVIPLLSGHIGGANALARKIAALLHAVPVVTTATDNHGRFSCDEWAATHQCEISSLATAKEIAARILIGDIPVSSEYPLPETLPSGLIASDFGEAGIYIGIQIQSPYTVTLRLIPKIVILGVGCRRGTPAETIEAAVENALAKHSADMRSIRELATIDVKRSESGMTEYAASRAIPIRYYSADELNAVCGNFSESAFVRQTVGTGNVCERAAVCGGGRLLFGKTVYSGVTVAAATAEWRCDFA